MVGMYWRIISCWIIQLWLNIEVRPIIVIRLKDCASAFGMAYSYNRLLTAETCLNMILAVLQVFTNCLIVLWPVIDLWLNVQLCGVPGALP